MNSLDTFETDVLDFIVYHTYHVLHPDGGPARVPLKFIVANFPSDKLAVALDKLKKKKLITSYIWNQDYNQGIRATSKACRHSKAVFKVPRGRRVLEIENNNIRLLSFEKWFGNGIVYTDGGIVHL